VSRPTLALLVAFSVLVPAPAQAAEGGAELIVRFRPGVESGERLEARRAAGAAFEERLPLAGAQVVSTEPGRSLAAVESELEADPSVLYAEPNLPRSAFRTPQADPAFVDQWALDNRGQVVDGRAGSVDADVDAPEAWDVTTGSPAVAVAVMDSGVELEHPDLAPGLWSNAAEAAGRVGVDDDRNGFVDDVRGWDFVDGDGIPEDLFGHGTHVSGIVGARIDDGHGIVGVAPGSRLLPIRTLDGRGIGRVDDAVRAYAYAARAGVRVLNASLGGPGGSTAERDAIREAGILVVAAAGNGGSDFIGDDLDRSRRNYPCAYDLENVICVAASDAHDALAPFTDYGAQTVDLAAPGTRIVSTFRAPQSYHLADGSSMAAPHVAGAAALLWAKNPGASVAQVRAALLAGVDRVPALAGRVITGGRLNARSSLDLLAPQPTSAPPPASAPAPLVVASGDLRAPRLALGAARSARLGLALRRGLSVRVRCSEACSARVRLVADARTARRLRLGRRAVTLARASVRLRRGGTRRVVVRPGRSARRALARMRRTSLLVLVTARDAAGNRTGARRVVTLRR
jgi:subtilisin family serine protease